MASLFEKISTLVAGIAHKNIDKMIAADAIAYLKQQVRNLEEAKVELRNEAAKAKGQVTSTQQNITATQAQITDCEESIATLLGDDDESNDHFAEEFVGKIDLYQEELTRLQDDLPLQMTVSAKLDECKAKLEEQHRGCLTNIKRLESADRSAKAKEKAAKALEVAGQLTSTADGVSVDNVARQIQDRANAADARLDQAMGAVTGSGGAEDAVKAAKMKARMAEIKAKYAKKA